MNKKKNQPEPKHQVLFPIESTHQLNNILTEQQGALREGRLPECSDYCEVADSQEDFQTIIQETRKSLCEVIKEVQNKSHFNAVRFVCDDKTTILVRMCTFDMEHSFSLYKAFQNVGPSNHNCLEANL